MSSENQAFVPPSFRDFRPEDAAEVAEIYNVYIRKGSATLDTVLRTSADILQMVAEFNPRECLILLTQGSQILGWGALRRNTDKFGYRVSCETSVYLQEDQQGKGYGTLIKKELIGLSRKLGYHHLIAKVIADNKASVVYNQKVGFEIVGRQREVGFLYGKWIDVYIMQLILDDVPPLAELL